MEPEFVDACDTEIQSNSHKGDWDLWEPSSKELSIEMAWHYAKFTQALLNGDADKIKEYACDMAVYCEKAFVLHSDFKKYDDKSKSTGYPSFSESDSYC